MSKKTQSGQSETETSALHSAAIINPDGSETPITEDMIKAACDNIESISSDEDKSRKTTR